MCEIPKIPKIHDYNRDKMVINQNEVVLNQKHKKHKGRNFAMHSDFRYISKISLYSKKCKK